jgi:ABC-2 type transport system ATP-binding protein
MIPIVETRSLSKTYRSDFGRKSVQALQDLSLSVYQGEIFALLGLNGAGKSTLMKILLDLVRPTSGEVRVFGETLKSYHWRRKVGYLPELFAVPRFMTALNVLRYLGELSGIKGNALSVRIDEMIVRVGLSEAANRQVHTFSKGMVLRLGVAQALLHQPQILFLDEPTEGLDPLGRKMVRTLLIDLANSGVTILLNSHLLSEVELVAHRVGILHKGRLRAQGKLSELLPQNQHFEVEVAENPSLEGPWTFLQVRSGWTSEVQGSEQLQQLLAALKSRSVPVLAVKPVRTTLEDVFFNYISGDGDAEDNSDQADYP